MNHTRDLKLTTFALVLLALGCVVFVLLGRWQLSRAAERRDIAAQINAGRTASPVLVTAATPQKDLTPWRAAQARGAWLPELSVLLDNRNQNGRPGLWLATPLLLNDGHAVLVLRGWFPRPMATGQGAVKQTGEPDMPPALDLLRQTDDVLVTGELAEHVPRLFEIWTMSGNNRASALPANWPDSEKGKSLSLLELPRLQNIELAELAKASGLAFLPAVIMQTDQWRDGLQRTWPEPSVDAEKNMGYALQWFIFAGIAAFAWVMVAVRARKQLRYKPNIGDNTRL